MEKTQNILAPTVIPFHFQMKNAYEYILRHDHVGNDLKSLIPKKHNNNTGCGGKFTKSLSMSRPVANRLHYFNTHVQSGAVYNNVC